MARKKKFSAKGFESVGESFTDLNGSKRKDTSANIYESMMISKAFMSLKPREKVLYLYCKMEFYGHRKPGADYPDVNEVQGPEYFYFNWALALQCKLYTLTSSRNFYRDMQTLEEKGFIEKIVSGKGHKKKNIYKFSDRWKAYK